VEQPLRTTLRRWHGSRRNHRAHATHHTHTRNRRFDVRRCAGEPHVVGVWDGAVGAGARVPATQFLTSAPGSNMQRTEPTEPRMSTGVSQRMLSDHEPRMSTAMTCLTIGLHTCMIDPAPTLAHAPRHAAPRTDAPSRSHHTQLRAGACQTPFPAQLYATKHLRGVIRASEIIASGSRDTTSRPEAELAMGSA